MQQLDTSRKTMNGGLFSHSCLRVGGVAGWLRAPVCRQRRGNPLGGPGPAAPRRKGELDILSRCRHFLLVCHPLSHDTQRKKMPSLENVISLDLSKEPLCPRYKGEGG